ncbi:hypothetical protein ACWG0P_06615 [Amedibacillus sp. YH-ame6]
MKKIILIICACLFLVACIPQSKSSAEEELSAALTIPFTFVSTQTSRDDNGLKTAVYTFEDENGVSFTHKSGFYKGSYGPAFYSECNYAEVLLAPYQDTLEAHLKKGFRTNFLNYCLEYTIYVPTYDSLEQAAQAIFNAIQSVEPMPIDREQYPFYLPKITVNHDDGTTGSFVTSFSFRCNEENLTETEILESLQRSYADSVKRGSIDETLPPEIMEKYPVSRIYKIFVGEDQIDKNQFTVRFNVDLNEYTVEGLDPCKESVITSLYLGKGAFPYLVNLLGGSYSSEIVAESANRDKPRSQRWEGGNGTWTIGENTWTARLTPHIKEYMGSTIVYFDLETTKNGKKVKQYPYRTEESFGKDTDDTFTVSELEEILGIDIVIDQTNNTMTFVKP